MTGAARRAAASCATADQTPNSPGKPSTCPAGSSEELELFRERVHSPEAAEAFAAFMEKRAADFSRFA